MKTTIKIFIILNLLILLKCCAGLFYTSMTHLSPEDLKWTKCYSSYPTGIFVNNSGKQLKLYMISHSTANSTNPFYISSGPSSTYRANSFYSFEIETTPKEILGSCFIEKRKGEDFLYIESDLGAMRGQAYIPQDVSSIELKGRVFDNCIVFEIGKNLKSIREWVEFGNPLIEKYIISRDYGLLYFKMNDGEEYFRKFKRRD